MERKEGAYSKAVALLAMREHSVHELQLRLSRKGFDEIEISQAIEALVQEGLQSDTRFTEAYIRMRKRRGFGAQRIQMELKERGISEDIISKFLRRRQEDWKRQIRYVWQKKFHGKRPKHYTEKARQMRFLQHRGFKIEQIQWVWKSENEYAT